MISSYVVQQPEHNWLKQRDKDSFVSIRKIFEKFGSTTVTGCDTVSYIFNVSNRVVLKRTSSGIPPFNMIVELGSSNIKTDYANNEVAKLKQRYVYRGKDVEGIVKTRMRQ